MTVPSLVLLSGGLDSVAALLLECKWGSGSVEALFIDYGQPMRDRERAAAMKVTDDLAVPLHFANIRDAFQAVAGGLMASPPSGRDAQGRDTAFLPGRNAVLLSVAASLAQQRWPKGARLIVGFNRGDAEGFPDCRGEFVDRMTDALQLGGALVRIYAPWITHAKRQIVEWCEREDPTRLQLLRASWSCYSADGPCGRCTACVTRAAALD